MSETTSTRKPHLRALIVSTTVLVGGILASLAGNVQAINLDGPAGTGETISALAWPLALFGAIEVMLHTPWVRSWRDNLTKWAGLLGAAFIALYVSYGHLQDVLTAYGYDTVSSHAGPLAIDLTMAMATLSLNRVGQQRRAAAVSTPMSSPAPVDTEDMPPLEEDPEEVILSTPPAEEDTSMDTDGSVWDSLVDRLGGQEEPTLPMPVSPAPSGTPSVDKVPATARRMIDVWLDTPVNERPSVADMATLVGAAHGRSAKTARRWRDAMITQ